MAGMQKRKLGTDPVSHRTRSTLPPSPFRVGLVAVRHADIFLHVRGPCAPRPSQSTAACPRPVPCSCRRCRSLHPVWAGRRRAALLLLTEASWSCVTEHTGASDSARATQRNLASREQRRLPGSRMSWTAGAEAARRSCYVAVRSLHVYPDRPVSVEGSGSSSVRRDFAVIARRRKCLRRSRH
jgi:hypothetical protein